MRSKSSRVKIISLLLLFKDSRGRKRRKYVLSQERKKIGIKYKQIQRNYSKILKIIHCPGTQVKTQLIKTFYKTRKKDNSQGK